MNGKMYGRQSRGCDAVVAIAAGTSIAIGLNIWYNVVARPETIESYMWLARLHEPAGSIAERLAHALYPQIGYPWCVRWALVCGYLLLVSAWALATFLAIKVGRLLRSAWRQVTNRPA